MSTLKILRNPTALMGLVFMAACGSERSGAAQPQAGEAAPAALANAAIHGEQLLADAPAGWQQTSATKTPALRIAEFVPPDTNRNDWQEKVTFESLSGDPLPDPIDFVTGIGADQSRTCEGFEHVNIQSGIENNYPTSVRLLTCNLNRLTKRGQVTLIKAIQGNDYFYVITRTKRVAPIVAGQRPISETEMATWATYLRSIRVCDPDREQHPC